MNTTTAALANPTVSGGRRAVALWLLACCVLIFAMVVLGGVTRLTHSGLSMVEWDPIMGVVPPVGEQQWEAAFEKYKHFPEYRERNFGMSVAQFKGIYYVEYAHRMLGRAIGIVFLLPLLYFLWRGRVDRRLAPKLVALFVLGGLQGLMGWYMVQSGLVDRPSVSQYRLTAHLVFAFAIYGYMLWVAMDLLAPARALAGRRDLAGVRRMAWAVTALIVVMVVTGGFVAGTKAGFAFNTFPLMNGRLVPEGYFAMAPAWHNFTENIATIQFNHRWLAILTGVAVVGLWWAGLRRTVDGATRTAFHVLLALVLAQIALGITTLLMVVPVALGAAHQGGALALLSGAIVVNHRLRGAG